MVSQATRKVTRLPASTTAYMLRMRIEKRTAMRPGFFMSRVNPMEKSDTGKVTSEMMTTKKPDSASPRNSNWKTEDSTGEAMSRGTEMRSDPPAARKKTAP